jgi:hypothetical protein
MAQKPHRLTHDGFEGALGSPVLPTGPDLDGAVAVANDDGRFMS